jgi:Ca2+-binding RTX toxin-like protein
MSFRPERIDDDQLARATGGVGGQTLSGTGALANLTGTARDDLIGTDARFSSVSAGEGDDTVRGGAGWDDLDGGGGADLVEGGGADDVLRGGTGDHARDTVSGGEGTDRVYWQPGDGNDVLDGGAGGLDMLDVSRGLDFAAFQAAFHPAGGAVTLQVDGMGNVTAHDASGNRVAFEGELRLGEEVVKVTGFERVFVKPGGSPAGPDAYEQQLAQDEAYWTEMFGGPPGDGTTWVGTFGRPK